MANKINIKDPLKASINNLIKNAFVKLGDDLSHTLVLAELPHYHNQEKDLKKLIYLIDLYSVNLDNILKDSLNEILERLEDSSLNKVLKKINAL